MQEYIKEFEKMKTELEQNINNVKVTSIYNPIAEVTLLFIHDLKLKEYLRFTIPDKEVDLLDFNTLPYYLASDFAKWRAYRNYEIEKEGVE